METSDIVNQIKRLRVFRGGATISSAARSCSASRPTIHRFVSDAEDWKLLTQSSDNWTLTTAGELILREYDHLDEKQQDDLSILMDYEHGASLLQILRESSVVRKAEMVRRSGATRETVRRFIGDFCEECENHKLVKEENGGYKVNSAGKQVIDAYNDFGYKVDVIEDKIEFLERYEEMGKEIPIEVLAESRIEVSTTSDRRKVEREVNKLEPGDAEPLRAISHAFSEKISDRYWSKISPDTKCEIIVDRKVYRAIAHPKGWKYLFKALRRSNFQLLIYPENLSVGVFHFGDEQAGVAAYNEDNPLHVALIGESDIFIEWVEDVYENYREDSTTPGNDLVKWAVNR